MTGLDETSSQEYGAFSQALASHVSAAMGASAPSIQLASLSAPSNSGRRLLAAHQVGQAPMLVGVQ